MSTSGVFGFRKNEVDKVTYIHYDCYPDHLGREVIKFCRKKTLIEINDLYDNVIMLDESIEPTDDEISKCREWTKEKLSKKNLKSWYRLTASIRRDIDPEFDGLLYMINSHDFIKNSLFCEYGYIVNLDTNKLEYWHGFQKTPDTHNRYGTQAFNKLTDGDNYYPCKLMREFDLICLLKKTEIVRVMNEVAYGDADN